MARKNPGAAVLGRKGGKKASPARTAKSTRERRVKVTIVSESKTGRQHQIPSLDTSDQALATLLNRLRVTVDPAEIRQLSDQIERVIFHRQLANA